MRSQSEVALERVLVDQGSVAQPVAEEADHGKGDGSHATGAGRRIKSASSSCLMMVAGLLLAPVAMASTPADTAASLQARIQRVERGLSTPVVIKDAPNQRMLLSERMAFHQVPAVSIAVINNGRLEWARAYGVLDTVSRRPTSPTTLFQAGSVSKPVSAMAALRLVEQGKLSLDGEANQQLRSWKIPENRFTRESPVTLRRLLNHGAGMNVHGFHGYAKGAPVPSLLQVLDGLSPANSDPVRVEATPGTQWKYSGGGYSVAQLMMVEAGGRPFPELMQALVLGPLAMRDSSFAATLPRTWQARAAIAHHSDGQAVVGGWHAYPESAAAALWTTPTDLAKVVVDIEKGQGGRRGTVLSSAMTATMLKRGLGEYGLGFYVETLGEGSSFGHSGGTDGFRSQLYGYTHTGQGAVVMTNSDNGAALIEEILISIATEYGWPEFQVIEKVAIASDPAVNASIAGEYELAGEPAHVIAEEGRLYLQSKLFGAARMELFAQSRSRFFVTSKDMTLDFQLTGDDRVGGFSLTRGGTAYLGTRRK